MHTSFAGRRRSATSGFGPRVAGAGVLREEWQFMGVKLTPVSDDGAEARLTADGDVRLAGSAAGVNPFAEALGPAWAGRKVLIDFGRATFIDSAAIGWLMASAREFRKGGGIAVL